MIDAPPRAQSTHSGYGLSTPRAVRRDRVEPHRPSRAIGRWRSVRVQKGWTGAAANAAVLGRPIGSSTVPSRDRRRFIVQERTPFDIVRLFAESLQESRVKAAQPVQQAGEFLSRTLESFPEHGGIGGRNPLTAEQLAVTDHEAQGLGELLGDFTA